MVIDPKTRVIDHLFPIPPALIAENLCLQVHKGAVKKARRRVFFRKHFGKHIAGAVQKRILHNVVHIVLRPFLRYRLLVHKFQDPPFERDQKPQVILDRKTPAALLQIPSCRHLARLWILVILLLRGVDIRAHHREPVLLEACKDLCDKVLLPDLHIVVHHNHKVGIIFAHRIGVAKIVALCKAQVFTGLQHIDIGGVLIVLLKSLDGPIGRTVVHNDDLLFALHAVTDRLHAEDRLIQRHVVQYYKTYHVVYSFSPACCPSSSA